MQFVRAGAGDGANHAAGRAPELRHGIGRDHLEFLNGVDSKIATQNAARPGVRVIVDVDAIKKIAILLRSTPGNAELAPQSALRTITCRDRRLRLNYVDSRGQ